MKQDEAIRKWCPFSRVLTFDGTTSAGCNRVRDGSRYKSTNCIASDCMMWRSGAHYNEGYCGLAGNPRSDHVQT